MSSPRATTDTYVAEASVNATEREDADNMRSMTKSDSEESVYWDAYEECPDEYIDAVLMKCINVSEEQKAPTSAQQEVPSSQLLCEWNTTHCSILIYELMTRVFQGKEGPEYVELFRYLMEHLNSQITEWDIQVEPDIRHIKKVAKAVYTDLCKDFTKKRLKTILTSVKDLNPKVTDSIHKNLVTPRKTSRFRTCLQSVCKACCLSCRGR